MSFNSYVFIFTFLPLSLIGYFSLNHFKQYSLAKIFLILMSFWFYGYFNPSYLVIMIGSIIINYILSGYLLKSDTSFFRKSLLGVGLLFNIGILFYFKYYDFFILNINSAFTTDFNFNRLILPLGISFFTFQQLSYVIDSYKKTVPKYNFFDYSLFVTFFPQLVAGPIVLHSEVIPQFEDFSNKKPSADNFAKGIMAFSFGLGKKVLLADTLGRVVAFGFGDVLSLDTTNAILVMLAYTFQIYFDFSGYCDMATGIGYMFNITLPINFNSPYKAVTILDFWDRWHITLTRFFTRYIYIPLGGSRKGTMRTYINVLIVFTVSGLWHGANWTFIVWGVVHGAFSVFTRIFKKYIDKLPKFINWLTTFVFVNFAWVIFRADSLQQAKSFFGKIIQLNFGAVYSNLLYSLQLSELKYLNKQFFNESPTFLLYFTIVLFTFSLFACTKMKNTNERIDTFKPNILNAMLTALILSYSIFSLGGISTFLYFNF